MRLASPRTSSTTSGSTASIWSRSPRTASTRRGVRHATTSTTTTRAAIDLAEWLDDTRLTLNSMHAPISRELRQRHLGRAFRRGRRRTAARKAAVDEAQAALAWPSVPFRRHLVVHLGVPDRMRRRRQQPRRARAQPRGAAPVAARLGVRLALEVIPNPLSTPTALVALIENDLEGATSASAWTSATRS